MKSFADRLTRRFFREDGTASIEFVLMVPLFITIFMASFESGFFMVRQVLLERSVDMVVRDLRLGHIQSADVNTLRKAICANSLIFSNCEANMMVELDRVSTTTWDIPATQTACINRDQNVQPVTNMQIGQQNDVMLIRVCEIQNAIFPTTGIGLNLSVDSQGGYQLIARSAFVVEPT